MLQSSWFRTQNTKPESETYIKINKIVDFDFFVPLELTLHNQPYLLDWFLSSYIASSPHNLKPSGACTAIMHPPYISSLPYLQYTTHPAKELWLEEHQIYFPFLKGEEMEKITGVGNWNYLLAAETKCYCLTIIPLKLFLYFPNVIMWAIVVCQRAKKKNKWINK